MAAIDDLPWWARGQDEQQVPDPTSEHKKKLWDAVVQIVDETCENK